jgi:hypothetical protein
MNSAPVHEDLSAEALLGQIADEFLDRLNRGERPDVEDYARRYPALAPLLRQVARNRPAARLSSAPRGSPCLVLLGSHALLPQPLSYRAACSSSFLACPPLMCRF